MARAYTRAEHQTIGVDIGVCDSLQLWDVAGEPVYEPLAEVSTRNAAVIVLAYRDTASFIALQQRFVPRARVEQRRCVARGRSAPRLLLLALDADERDAVHEAYARSIGAEYALVTVASRVSRADAFRLITSLIDTERGPRASDD